jgi:hypothetical protein
MPEDIERCVAAIKGKEGVDNPHALCNWMKAKGKGYFSSHSPDDEGAMDEAIGEYQKTMKESRELFECIDLHEGRGKVDRDRGLIEGVKILGWNSANGRRYEPSGVDPKLYEGRPINLNHNKGSGDRDARDRLGRITNVEKRPDGLYGTLHLLTSHEMADRVFEAAERMPNAFGLSHTARGRERPGPNGSVIEAVQSVSSVDLVSDPASVSGLYESRGRGVAKVRVRIRDLIESLKYTRPGYAAGLRRITEQDEAGAEAGIMSPDAMMEEPEPPADLGGGEGADHEQAIRDACKAVIDDTALTPKEQLKKISALLRVIEGGGGGGGGGEGATEESRQLARYRARDRVRTAADMIGVRVPVTLLETINPEITEQQARALVAELRGSPVLSRPGARSAMPMPAHGILPGGGGTLTEARVPEDPAARARWVREGR